MGDSDTTLKSSKFALSSFIIVDLAILAHFAAQHLEFSTSTSTSSSLLKLAYKAPYDWMD